MIRRLFLLAGLALASAFAHAAPVTVSFAGAITQAENPNGMLGSAFPRPVVLGTPVSVSFTFDLDLFGPDTSGGFGTVGSLPRWHQLGRDPRGRQRCDAC